MTDRGKIFIEKPFQDIDLKKAEGFKDEILKEKKKDAVFGFDHYLARSYPFLKNVKENISKIGGINKIEFRTLEDYPFLQKE